jgi:hypothetical protein
LEPPLIHVPPACNSAQVHERDLNTDFLLIILKKLLAFRPDLKVMNKSV